MPLAGIMWIELPAPWLLADQMNGDAPSPDVGRRPRTAFSREILLSGCDPNNGRCGCSDVGPGLWCSAIFAMAVVAAWGGIRYRQ